MNNRVLMGCIEKLNSGQFADLSFISPIVSAGLSAWLLMNQEQRGQIRLGGDAVGYAAYVGFTAIVEGSVTPVSSSELESPTMSPLTSLVYPSEVEYANRRVATILDRVLLGAEKATMSPLGNLIGELR